jgi:hypothetical protein
MLPVFVTVRAIALLVVLVVQLPKANGFGVTVIVRTVATPVPEIETGAPLTVPLVEVMVSEAEEAPAAVGVNVTVMVQLVPALSVPGQFVVRVNGAARVPMLMGALTVPSFVSVRVCVGEGVVPITTLPNANVDGDTTKIGVLTAVWYSIAPMSKRGWLGVEVSGLA